MKIEIHMVFTLFLSKLKGFREVTESKKKEKKFIKSLSII